MFRTSALGFPSGEQLCVGGQAAEETGQTGTSASLEQACPLRGSIGDRWGKRSSEPCLQSRDTRMGQVGVGWGKKKVVGSSASFFGDTAELQFPMNRGVD